VDVVSVAAHALTQAAVSAAKKCQYFHGFFCQRKHTGNQAGFFAVSAAGAWERALFDAAE
jgi:hypothetical protein